MRFDGNYGATPNYDPSSAATPRQAPAYAEPPLRICGDADCYDHHLGDDPYQQAGDLFRLMTADEQERLTGNIANAMRSVPAEIRQRQLAHFDRADPRYGALVAGKL